MALVELKFKMDSEHLNQIIEAIAIRDGWTEELGITKGQFAKQRLHLILKGIVKSVRGEAAAEEVRTLIAAEIDAWEIT